MRRILAGLSALLVLMHAGSASAQPETDPASPVVLQIVNDARFEGMDQTYQCGYVPTVRNGFVLVVLPLTAEMPVAGSEITVTADLGASPSTPFVCRNYSKCVRLLPWPIDDGEQTREVFLVCFDLQLAQLYEAGCYPVILYAAGMTEDGTSFEQAFTVYVTLTQSSPPSDAEDTVISGQDTSLFSDDLVQGEDPVVEGPADDTVSEALPHASQSSEPTPEPPPRLILAAHSLDPPAVVAGTDFTVHASLQNTSGHALQNVEVDVIPEGSALLSGNGSASFYFARIAPKESVPISCVLGTQATAGAEPQTIRISCVYNAQDGQQYTSESSFTFEIVQPVRLDWDSIAAPASVNAGDTVIVPVQTINLGRGSVRNIRVQLDVPGFVPEGSLFLGNLASGEAKSGDIYAFVDMAGSGDERYGAAAGEIVLTGEGESGQPLRLTQSYETVIEPPVLTAAVAAENTEDADDASAWQWATICTCVGCSILVLALLLHRRKFT